MAATKPVRFFNGVVLKTLYGCGSLRGRHVFAGFIFLLIILPPVSGDELVLGAYDLDLNPIDQFRIRKRR